MDPARVVSGPVSIQVWVQPGTNKGVVLLSDIHRSDYGQCPEVNVEQTLYNLYTPGNPANFKVLLENAPGEYEDINQIVPGNYPLVRLRQISDSARLAQVIPIINADMRIGQGQLEMARNIVDRAILGERVKDLSLLQLQSLNYYRDKNMITKIFNIVPEHLRDRIDLWTVEGSKFITQELCDRHGMSANYIRDILIASLSLIKMQLFITCFENNQLDIFVISESQSTADARNNDIMSAPNYRDLCTFWSSHQQGFFDPFKSQIIAAKNRIKGFTDRLTDGGQLEWHEYAYILACEQELQFPLVAACSLYMDVYSMAFIEANSLHTVIYFGLAHNEVLSGYLAYRNYILRLGKGPEKIYLNGAGVRINNPEQILQAGGQVKIEYNRCHHLLHPLKFYLPQ